MATVALRTVQCSATAPSARSRLRRCDELRPRRRANVRSTSATRVLCRDGERNTGPPHGVCRVAAAAVAAAVTVAAAATVGWTTSFGGLDPSLAAHAADIDVMAPQPQQAQQLHVAAPDALWLRVSELESLIRSGRVESLLFARDGSKVAAFLRGEAEPRVVATELYPALATQLLDLSLACGVDVNTAHSDAEFDAVAGTLDADSRMWRTLRMVVMAAPFLILPLTALFFALRSVRRSDDGSAGGGGMFDFFRLGRSPVAAQKSTVTFADVAGVDGAKLELREVVDFLKSPEKYAALGAKVPKGCLLTGPPGTGKTLLAKAVAGEAGVPFFNCAASEFVEMFVGVGASRVRDLFKRAKAAAPCIIFIDELDAVGRQRGVGFGSGSDEREQTINQLLSELDGFEGNDNIICLAATNRPDVLDPALLRPGRFDRQINVDLPDLQGRVDILRVHARKLKLAPDADLRALAGRTTGMSGADLANVLNEAAICAARRGRGDVSNAELNDALDTVMLGPTKQHAWLSPDLRRVAAVHEAGHAIVGATMPGYDSIQTVSVVPRTRGAGGVTSFAPNEERLTAGFLSRTYLLSQLSVALGGRAAEELELGAEAVTTGAASDLRQVTRTARVLVEQCGLSRRFKHASVTRGGASSLGGGPAPRGGFGRLGAPDIGCAMATVDEIDAEIRAVVDEAYNRAKTALVTNRGALRELVARLLEKETVDGAELQSILVKRGARLCTSVDVARGEE